MQKRMLLTLVVLVAAGAAWSGQESGLPPGWRASWETPPAVDRPLQIVHGINPKIPMAMYRDRGLGGVVCNVAFSDYLRSEENWRTLIAGVEACRDLGLVVWLYDEDGYPSGAAGGLVLQENPAYEALELTYDPKADDPFAVRPAYEFTHASNNFYAARRYPNLIDAEAVRSFIRLTHEAYWKRLQSHFGKTIQAMFTDEPSLIAVNLGPLPDHVRKNVRVVDPLDAAVRPLPCVPWSRDIVELYRKRYGDDLMARRRSLFDGQTAEDREVRRRFYVLVADLITERYFGALQAWCGRHGIASSGHSLWEEAIMHHPALEGNGLKALGAMDIPGLDMLSSDPEAVIHTGWLTAALPSSAAELAGRRRVMTEVSDFIQKMGGAGPSELPAMQATAAWQAAWGVTDFTLYYGLNDRSAEELRAYGGFVGRLNAVLKPARRDADVLLYYPIDDLWAEYVPVAEPLTLESQSPRAQRIVRSFLARGQELQRRQIPCTLIDHEHLSAAVVGDAGTLTVGDHTYGALILPEGVELHPQAAAVVDAFRKRGGIVRAERLKPAYRLEPASERITLGAFVRDGRRVVLVVNVGANAYEGRLLVPGDRSWTPLDPAAGTTGAAAAAGPGALELTLAPRQARILVEGPR